MNDFKTGHALHASRPERGRARSGYVVMVHQANATLPALSATLITTVIVWPGVQSPQLTLTVWSITSGLASESGKSIVEAQSELGPVAIADTLVMVMAWPFACVAVKVAFTLPVHGIAPVCVHDAVIGFGGGGACWHPATNSRIALSKVSATTNNARVFMVHPFFSWLLSVCLLGGRWHIP
ncbi:MAG: hypothetical protein WEE20_08155 [Bacteroidota bacterium]